MSFIWNSEDGMESSSAGTHEHTESEDTDQDKVVLLSPRPRCSDVSFIKEMEEEKWISFR